MNVKSGTKIISVVLPAEVLSKIEAIAEATEHLVDWRISRVLRTYPLNEGRDVLNSIEGNDQITVGKFVDTEGVIVDLEHLIK
ncbi:hypothetical protein [Brucella tritici]|uniref:CopG family transcriptional regulator n=1 Tax=Brucella tritici TaxID=94626 RepID=A0A6L3Y9M2_9HYPH|nr:hypothetical protein [Brucella tritici]KAB2680017.1 hypothetical protein F9L08_21710 [Brucella tritici]